MDQQKLEELVSYVVGQGVKAIKDYTTENFFAVDYLAIFTKDEDEFNDLSNYIKGLGQEVDPEKNKTGLTILLDKPLSTKAGELRCIKARRPDPTRPQRGAPDFRINNYQEFKNKYLGSSGNFTLMPRKDYEMMELKGVDVLVYFPSKFLAERLQK